MYGIINIITPYDSMSVQFKHEISRMRIFVTCLIWIIWSRRRKHKWIITRTTISSTLMFSVYPAKLSTKLRATEYKNPATRFARVFICVEYAFVRVWHVVRRVECVFTRVGSVTRHDERAWRPVDQRCYTPRYVWTMAKWGVVSHITRVTRVKLRSRDARRRLKLGNLR